MSGFGTGVDLRLALPAVAGWLAAIVLVGAPHAGWWVAGGAWALGVLSPAAAALHRRRRRSVAGGSSSARGASPAAVAQVAAGRAGAVLVGAAVVGLIAASVANADARRSAPLESAPGTIWELRVDGRPGTAYPAFDGSAQVRFAATLVAVDPAGDADSRAGLALAVPVRVTAPAADPTPVFGALVRVEVASARPAEAGDRAALLVRAASSPEVVSLPAWAAWAGTLGDEFAAAAEALPGDGGALVPGLAVGDTTAVGDDLDAAMKTSSLSHLTAVSGANCAIVTAAGLALASLAGLGGRTRLVVAGAALFAFVAIVTPEASVVRAATMAGVVLVALALGRGGGGVPALSVAVVGLLAVDPWYARDAGFALSVLATAGLLLLAPPIARRFARIMPVPLAEALALSVAAQLACQPVLTLLAPAVPVFGVAANLLAAPAAPVATVVGLLACLALPVLPGVAHALLWIAWLPATWIAALARTTAALPGASAGVPDGAVGVVLVTLGVVGVVVAWLADRRRVRLAAAVAVAVLLGAWAGWGWVADGLRTANRPADWVLAACDVGQGDAVLVRAGGATLLVDTGPDVDALSGCLGALRIDHVDVLVLSHFDADHVGATAALAGRVGLVLVADADDPREAAALAPLGDTPVERVSVGDGGAVGGIRWSVAWPRAGAPGGNDASVVLLVDAGGLRTAFLGDLGEQAQRAMATGGLPHADVVKVAHHGSADQYDRAYEQLGARVGLVSVGADNGYGHPTDRALELVRAAGGTPVRTDESGLVLVAQRDGAPVVWVARGAGDAAAAVVPAWAVAGRLGADPTGGSRRGGTAWPAPPDRQPRRRRSRFRSSAGTRCDPRPWCS
ncbi:ComEC/Rec2 family competence protein [Agromyces sp. SYSU T00194]|uniref:ComEC/Rec2 family competence protein n=1 Tax=Agromyces chitinivorans TaxID=3158560 RepID=UPI00339AD431